MDTNDLNHSRRNFLGALATGTTGILASSFPQAATAFPETSIASEADEWLKKIKGTHRIIFDAPEPHNGFPVVWSWVFFQTNNQTGSPDNDLTVMVVLRQNGIPLAMEDRLWAKYKFGEVFKINDNNTKTPAIRNVFYEPKGADFRMSTIEGIKRLQERGAMFCVCDMALTVQSSVVAQATGQKPEDVKKDWVSGVLPGIQVVPSGVWAIARAQKNGCAYCYAGG